VAQAGAANPSRSPASGSTTANIARGEGAGLLLVVVLEWRLLWVPKGCEEGLQVCIGLLLVLGQGRGAGGGEGGGLGRYA